MKLYLNAGFARPIGSELCNEISRLGFYGVRQGVPDDHERAWEVLYELANHTTLHPILLIAGGHMKRGHPEPGGEHWTREELVRHTIDVCIKVKEVGLFEPGRRPPAFEIGNEPDLKAAWPWNKNPRLLTEAFAECYEVIRRYSAEAPVLSPSVSNLNKRGLRYLAKMRGCLPKGAELAVHWYPHDGDPRRAHDGFDDRQAEIRELLRLAEDRPIWITETGLSEGPHSGRYHTEEGVAKVFESEMRRWRVVPHVKAVVWYQLNDGSDHSEILHNYGIRRSNNEWKPVAQRIKALAQEVA